MKKVYPQVGRRKGVAPVEISEDVLVDCRGLTVVPASLDVIGARKACTCVCNLVLPFQEVWCQRLYGVVSGGALIS